MAKEAWIEDFGTREGEMLYHLIQEHKKESEVTDVSIISRSLVVDSRY